MPFAVEIPPSDKQAETFGEFYARFEAHDFTFFIRERDSRSFLGGCGLHPRVGPLGCEVGYWLRQDAIGQGYATEAVMMLCRLGFEQERLDRVELRVEPSNEPSIAVARRLGFAREALLRRRFPWPAEAPRDVWVFTLFKSEFDRLPWRGFEMQCFDASGAQIR